MTDFLGVLTPGRSFVVTFKVTINPFAPSGQPGDASDDPNNACGTVIPNTQTAVINKAIVSAESFTFEDDATTCAITPSIDIEKAKVVFKEAEPALSDGNFSLVIEKAKEAKGKQTAQV